MSDEQKQPLLEEWFSDREEASENVQQGVARVMSEVSQTRQQGRWLPLPLHPPSPTSTTPSTTDTTEYQPSPVPATNGHTPTVIMRTQSMLSPVKAITAGALIFAIGSVLLIAQPFEQPGSSVPGAATDTEFIPPVVVTGTVGGWREVSPGELTVENGLERQEGVAHTHVWTADDSRLSGDVTYTGNWHVYPGVPEIALEGGTYELVNEDGRWLGTAPVMSVGSVDTRDPVIFTGEGDYEGLSAYVLINFNEPGDPTFSGVIFQGRMPAFPEPATIE